MILLEAISRGRADRRLRRRNRRRIRLSERHVEPHLMIGDMATGQWLDPFDEETHPHTQPVAITRSPEPHGETSGRIFRGLRFRSGYALPPPQARKNSLILIVARQGTAASASIWTMARTARTGRRSSTGMRKPGRVRLAASARTPGACTTRWEMFWSGAPTGSRPTRPSRQWTRAARTAPTPSASFAAGPGTTARGSPALRSVTGSARVAASTALAFGAPEFRRDRPAKGDAAAGLPLGRPQRSGRAPSGKSADAGGGQDHQGRPQGSRDSIFRGRSAAWRPLPET